LTTRTSSNRDHGAEDALGPLLNLTRAAALGACDYLVVWLSPVTITSAAFFSLVDAKLYLGTEGSLLKSDLDPCLDVPATWRTAAPSLGLESTEATAEHTAEYPAEDVVAEAHVPEDAAEVCSPEDILLAVGSANASVSKPVILGFLLLITQNRVGFTDLLELLLGTCILVAVRVVLER